MQTGLLQKMAKGRIFLWVAPSASFKRNKIARLCTQKIEK